MQIIDNVNGSHYKSILNMLSEANGMTVASPFLMEDFHEFIYDVASLGIKNISLITTLKDNNPDLLIKASSLYSFVLACKKNDVSYDIRTNNRLHGKLYIALNGNNPLKGIVTSANLTSNGLSHSHEWGVEFDDESKLQGIIEDLYKYSSSPISNENLDHIIRTIDEYQTSNPPVPQEKPKIVVSKFIKKGESTISNEPENADVKYFLKPMGSSERPYTPDRVINRGIQELGFSKRKPSSVKPGDILICYGVGTRKLLGYFKVLTEPVRMQDESERWPWRVDAANLCPDYSDRWTDFENTLASLQLSYGDDKEITFVGGKSLGSLNFGADKIQLNPDFAKHIINTIENSV